MSFGPELIWCWSKFLSGAAGAKVRKAEAGDNWAMLSLPGRDALLLSWDAQACGVAIVPPGDKKRLLAAARQTPTILGALKKHIAGAELAEVRQLRRDKLLELTFRRAVSAEVSITRHLILEAMERYSNLILTDETNTIIETAKHIHPDENRFRTILPGFPYTPPPEFRGVALEDWLRAPSSANMTKISGFGAPLLRALSGTGTENAAEILSQYYDDSKPSCQKLFLAQAIGRYITFSPILADTGTAERIGRGIDAAGRATTLNALLDRNLSSRRKVIENHINREISRRERQCADIRALLERDAEVFRENAELIISNLHVIEPGTQSCELSGWDETGAPVTAAVKLNPALTPQKNAALLFDKYKKTVASQKRAAKLLEKVKLELDALREQLPMVSLAEEEPALAAIEEELGMGARRTGAAKKKHGGGLPFPPHKRFDLGYALVFAGLSAGGNRYVTFDLAQPNDVWFHAQGVPGSHVILRFNREPSDERLRDTLRFCASLAVWFSKARENGKARVDFTRRKYVSSIKGSIAGVTYKEFDSITGYGDFWRDYLTDLEYDGGEFLSERS